jgi:hypothetical protein
VGVRDVLSSGLPEDPGDDPGRGAGGHPPAYRPRWLTGLVVLVLAVGLGTLAARQGTGRPRAAEPTPTRTTRVIPAPPATAAPDRAAEVPLFPDAVFQLQGVEGPGPAGTRLVVGGRAPGILDAATGRLTRLPVPGLRADETAWVRRGRGYTVVLLVGPRSSRAEAVLVPDGGGRVPLGPVSDALPMRDGTVLTLVCPEDNKPPCSMAGRTRSGGTVWTRRGGEPLGLLRDTPAGLVAVRYAGESWTLLVADPRTGRTLRDLGRIGSVLAVSDGRVAWTADDCTTSCPVGVTELADGRTRRMPASAGVPGRGAFSPDSERLAVGFMGLHSQDPNRTRQRDGYAAVLDLRTPGWVRAPGLATGPKSAPVPVWAGDDQVLLGVSDGDNDGRVALWRLGTERLTVLPVRLPGLNASPDEFGAA